MHFDRDALLLKLNLLKWSHVIAFAGSCSERLLPNYVTFFHEVRWGNPVLMRSALDEIWDSLLHDSFDTKKITSLIHACDEITPDTETFEASCTSYALDAATAIAETLELCIDKNPSHAVDVASFCRDSVHRFIHERAVTSSFHSHSETNVENSALMQAELSLQDETIRTLSTQSVLEPRFIESFRLEAISKATDLCRMIESKTAMHEN